MSAPRKTFMQRLFTLAGVCALYAAPVTAGNGLQSEMDKLFTEMSHTTAPGVFETQRRGVIAGGRFTLKTRIMDENLVSFAPPSWKGGCGGVDLFGGSLSFINADQIVQLLRSVAANAKGYAFQLALDNVFPDGAKWIENFQKKVQALNQHLGNSCQLAQGTVNDLTSGMDLKHKTDASITATASGLFEDFFGSRQESTGKSPMEELKANKPDEYKKMIGNIVWKQLKSNNAATWFRYGDTTLLESIMSLTGTVIVGDLVNEGGAGSSSKTTPITTLPGGKVTLADLINGGSVEIYSCASDTSQCLNAGTNNKTVALKGIKDQLTDALLGTGSSPGVIHKYATNAGTLSPQEEAFVANLPGGVGTIIRNLSVLSADGAALFATESSGAIALAMMYGFSEELFRAARLALANSTSPYKGEALKEMTQAQQQVRTEYTLLTAQYGDLATQIERYNNLLNNIRKQRYMLAAVSNPPRTN